MDDAPVLADIFRRAVLDQAPAFYTAAQTDAWAGAISLDRVRSLITEHTTFVAERDDTIVGFATFAEPDVFEMLYVDPDHCMQGVGGALATLVEEHARRVGVGALRATVSDCARIAFESFGFRHERPHTRTIGDQSFSVTLMSRSLG